MPVAAHAAPAGSYGFRTFPIDLAPGGTGPGSLEFTHGDGTPDTLTDAELVFDTSGIDRFGTLSLTSNGRDRQSWTCTTAKSTTTCAVEPVQAYGVTYGLPNLVVTARKGAKVGDDGTLKVTVRSKEVAPIQARTTVTVARLVDLAAQPLATAEPVAPGATVQHRVAVKNNGPAASTRGVAVRINADEAFDFGPRYRNCQYAVDTLADSVNLAWCTFAEPIAAGAAYELSAPFYKLRGNAAPDHQYQYYYTWATLDNAQQYADGWYEGQKYVAGTGDVLHLVPVKGQEPGQGDSRRAKVVEADLTHTNDLAQSLVKTPASSASPSVSASPTTGGAGGGDQAGGSLPITGSDTLLVGGAGVVLLAIGAGAFLFARRRRTSFTA